MSVRKSADAFRTISEVADQLEIQKHVLRFWEVKFPQVKPLKRGGGRRYYRPGDVELLRGIQTLLHNEGYTIKGVQKLLREQGIDFVKAQGGSKIPARKKTPERARPAVALSSRQIAVLRKAIDELQACRDVLADGSGAESAGSARSARSSNRAGR